MMDGAAPLVRMFGTFDIPEGHDVNVARTLSADLLARNQAGGRYEVHRELARGGMGEIYEVYDQDLCRISAMKVISPRLAADKRRLQAFVGEGRITAQLEHPNIAPVHEIGVVEHTGCPFYTMKLIEGEPLSKIIKRIGEGDRDYLARYSRHRLLDVFRRVCDAVAYAHSRHVIHRDIKPENIMVGQFGEVLLMDWGLAKYIGAKETEEGEPDRDRALRSFVGKDFQATEDGTIKGSLAYLSPEQAYGDLDEVDHHTDIFLLGATLYHLFTFSPPYEGADVQEIIAKAERCEYKAPSERNPAGQIPLALERIILKAMAPLKRNRYVTVQAMIDDIDAFLAGKRVCGRKIFAPGEMLIRHGDVSRDSFVIINGKVQVSRVVDGRDVPFTTLGRGEIVGEMAAITHQVRSANVMAMETTEALVITHDLLLEELEKLPPWMEKIVFSLADRVRVLDEHVHPLLLHSRAFHVVNQCYYIFAAGRLAQEDPTVPLTYPRLGLVEEICMNLGIDRRSTTELLDQLVGAGLCTIDNQGAMAIPNLREFCLFTDYCRYQFGVKGGMREVTEICLEPQTDSMFRRAARLLRECEERLRSEARQPRQD